MSRKQLTTVKVLRNQSVIADQVLVADQLLTRMKGLLGTSALAPGEGLWIVPTNSIHTFGMNYAIDVLFLGREHRVVDMVPNLKPWRMLLPRWKAVSCLELPAGTIRSSGVMVGDQLCIGSRS